MSGTVLNSTTEVGALLFRVINTQNGGAQQSILPASWMLFLCLFVRLPLDCPPPPPPPHQLVCWHLSIFSQVPVG
jgi:hypothetical protein